MAVRRLATNPWEVVRFRKNQRENQVLEVRLRAAPPLTLRGKTSDFHMFHRIFLNDEYRLRSCGGPRWECMVDLGGNIGVFTSRVAPHCARVITYEPEPSNFAALEANTRGYPNVTRVRAAVTDHDGEIRLYQPIHAGTRGVFSTHPEAELVSSDYNTVPAITLDRLFEQHQVTRCDLLKIDVEGAEYEILPAAAPETLARIERIHGEYHDVAPEKPITRIENFVPFLEAQGFAVDVDAHPRKPNHGMFFARRRS